MVADLKRGFSHSDLFRDLRQIEEGLKTMPETDAKRHHFVPKLLLRRFSARADRIWQLDKESGEGLDVRIDKASSRRRFYEFLHNDEGVRTSRMEAWLALVEGHACKVLRRLEHPGPMVGLADWDRATLAFFLALLNARTPAAIRVAEQVGRETVQLKLGTEWSDPEGFARRHAELFPDAMAGEAEELRLRALNQLKRGEIGFEDPAGAAMQTLVRGSGAMAQEIFESRWIVLRAREGAFVASDVGLAMHDPRPRFPWSSQAWHSSDEVEVTIPIGSGACLFITPGPATFERLDVGAEEVDEINLRTFGWSDRFLFGAEEEAMAALWRLAARRPDLIVKPKPRRMAILVELEEGDDSLADEHRRRGWPTHVAAPDPKTGRRRTHDYMVIGEDGEPIELAARAIARLRRNAEDTRTQQAA